MELILLGKMKMDWGLVHFGRIITISYTGVLTIKDLEDGWIEVLEQDIIKSNILGFVLDCRNSVMDIEVDKINMLSDLFKKNLDIFQQKRFAYVTSSPGQIILPLLLQEDDYLYESKPFSTPEAAMEWVLN